MTNTIKDIAKAAADRFCGWSLPQDFAPDCRISFDRRPESAFAGWPTGTNLLTHEQAASMFEYCLAEVLQRNDYKRGFSDGMKEAPTGECWIRVIDEAMVGAHLGVADMSDDYGTAKKKLNDLICWSVEVDRESARHAPAAQPVQGSVDKFFLPKAAHEGVVENTVGTFRMRISGLTIRQIKEIFEDKFLGSMIWSNGTAYPTEGVELRFTSTPQPDTRKAIEQMVGALENSSETVFICAEKALLREAAIQAGQQWL